MTEMNQAEKKILQYIQRQYYPDEVARLGKNKCIPKSSSLYTLEPMLDEDELLRLGGRLAEAPIPYDAKYPYILPRDHHVAELVVREVHEEAYHSGREHILALVRERFWIPRGRPLVKKVLQKCTVCKRLRGPTEIQKMADLPSERLTPHKPAFQSVGVDCFGPFQVKRGRSQEKRYGCLFTCMTTRAIHIEKLSTLDADSFINALVRFCARRGKPETIRSDNGTNFVGGQRELNQAIKSWNEANKTKKHLLLNHITWEFNPPSASHMGGIWERQIRTARKVMNAILRNQVLDDERLDTVFCEVEQVVNSRPLTPVPDDPKDASALTPNHLLLLRDIPVLCSGPYSKGDIYQRRWRHAQFIADCFWKRWMKQYLPLLRLRQKWLQPRRDIAVGDVVLIEEPTPRKHWPLAVVTKTFQSRDGRIRSAELKTQYSIVTRPLKGVN